MSGPTSGSESRLIAHEEKIEMLNEDFFKANDDYRREMLTRSWNHPANDAGHRRVLPHLRSMFRSRRAS